MYTYEINRNNDTNTMKKFLPEYLLSDKKKMICKNIMRCCICIKKFCPDRMTIINGDTIYLII